MGSLLCYEGSNFNNWAIIWSGSLSRPTCYPTRSFLFILSRRKCCQAEVVETFTLRSTASYRWHLEQGPRSGWTVCVPVPRLNNDGGTTASISHATHNRTLMVLLWRGDLCVLVLQIWVCSWLPLQDFCRCAPDFLCSWLKMQQNWCCVTSEACTEQVMHLLLLCSRKNLCWSPEWPNGWGAQ